jgi:hypothetical protein
VDPIQIAQAGFYITLMNAAAAVTMFSVITFLLLRIANHLSGVTFSKAYSIIEYDTRALSLYLSVRYAVLGLGNALIIASIFKYA